MRSGGIGCCRGRGISILQHQATGRGSWRAEHYQRKHKGRQEQREQSQRLRDPAKVTWFPRQARVRGDHGWLFLLEQERAGYVGVRLAALAGGGTCQDSQKNKGQEVVHVTPLSLNEVGA